MVAAPIQVSLPSAANWVKFCQQLQPAAENFEDILPFIGLIREVFRHTDGKECSDQMRSMELLPNQVKKLKVFLSLPNWTHFVNKQIKSNNILCPLVRCWMPGPAEHE